VAFDACSACLFTEHFFAEVEKILHPITSASYSSTDDRPGCLENTRVALQQQLSDWANKDAPEITILWLNGMTGTGKSAISTTFARNMAEEGLLGATFFIDRQVAERTTPHRIVQSLAYDLAKGDHSRLHALWSVLCSKPTIVEMPLREQVQALIMGPMDETYTETLVILIDGLDECVPSDGALLLSTLVDCLAGFPLKLFISSRNDPAISKSFADIHHIPISLQERPADEVAKDVRLYWEHSLDDLCRKRRITDWRHSVSLDLLVNLTGHLFVYAATILKMIWNSRRNPIDELKEHITTSSLGTSPTEIHTYSLLDDLYLSIIVQAVCDKDGTVNLKRAVRLRAILEVVIFARHPLTPRALSELLDFDLYELDAYLAAMVSVLVMSDATGADDVVRPLHRSFTDFVRQQGGCIHPSLTIDATIANAHLAEYCLAQLNKRLHFNMCDIRDPSLFNDEVENLESQLGIHVPLTLRYSCNYWGVHYLEYVRSSLPQDVVVPMSLLEFCNNHLLHWIELLSLLCGLNDTLGVLPMLLAALQVTIAFPSQYCG
jgi:hypothetical protein